MLLHRTSHGSATTRYQTPGRGLQRANTGVFECSADLPASRTSFACFTGGGRFSVPIHVATRKHFSSGSWLGRMDIFRHGPIKHHAEPGPCSSVIHLSLQYTKRNILFRNQLLEATMYRCVMDARVSRSRRIRVHGLGTVSTFGLARLNSTRATLGETVLTRVYSVDQAPATLESGARR
jgi:hypothetical protein